MLQKVNDLQIYQKSLQACQIAWIVYKSLSNELRWTIGRQFLRAVDSVGANIAEGYARFYYKDRLRFLYIARGSLLESRYWFKLLCDRDLVGYEHIEGFEILLDDLVISLNGYIKKQKGLIKQEQ